MNKGIEFSYKEKQITATVWEQQIWLSLSDIENIFDCSTALPDEKTSINVDGRLLKMISEFGVYRLSTSIDSEAAKKFREWFVGDAILRIRKYGCYKLSIAEEKEQIIKEIDELGGLSIEKLKYSTLDRLKLERAKLIAQMAAKEKEKAAFEKRAENRKEFPYSCYDLENKYDLNRAMDDIERGHKDTSEYWVHIDGSEYLFSEKFFEYIDDFNYML